MPHAVVLGILIVAGWAPSVLWPVSMPGVSTAAFEPQRRRAEWPPPVVEPKKKGREEEPTQVLELPKEPPSWVLADSRRLSFLLSPLSAQGLLSQQVRDGLRALLRQTRGGGIVRLRAFVAGSGDLRRVQAVVSEVLSERRLPLPALSVIQAGGLPLAGAQVVLEATVQQRQVVNPHGLAFISGQAAAAPDPLAPIEPLLEKSLESLRTAVRATGAPEQNVLMVTCFMPTLEPWLAVRRRLAAHFPHAVVNLLQPQRAPTRALVECEAVVRLTTAPARPLELRNPPELPHSEFYSQIALVGPTRLVLTGAQLGFRYSEDDARLAFQRLGRTLQEAGASFEQVAVSRIYPLTGAIGDMVRRVRGEFYRREAPPASTMLPFEGLPSLDASFGVDVIAVLPEAAPAAPSGDRGGG